MKPQAVRLLDVFALGPLMVWYAGVSRGPEWARAALGVAGLLTIAYNGANYLRAGRLQ